MFKITKITATKVFFKKKAEIFCNDTILTKAVKIGEDGKLKKQAVGNLAEAEAKVLSVENLAGLNEIMNKCEKTQALIYSLPNFDEAKIVVAPEIETARKANPNTNIIGRTKECFSWQATNSVMVLDYDPQPGQRILNKKELYDTIINTFPELKEVSMLIRDSTSAFIRNKTTGEWLVKDGGKKVYIIVSNGSKIENIGKVLIEKLWLSDKAFYVVNKAGALNERSIFDSSMWQKARLDYVAGAYICSDELEQIPEPPLLISEKHDVFDLDKIKKLKESDKKQVDEKKQIAKLELTEEVEKAKKKRIDELTEELIVKRGVDKETAKRLATQAIRSDVLEGDFQLMFENGEVWTVQDVLNDPDSFLGRRLHDPNDPEYNNSDNRIAMIIKDETHGKILINSFAHCGSGKKYILKPVGAKNIMIGGNMSMAIEKCFESLIDEQWLFFDVEKDCLVTINKTPFGVTTRSLYGDDVLSFLEAKFCFYMGDKEITAPERFCKQICIQSRNQLPELHGITELPILRKDGSVFVTGGYDAATKIYQTDTYESVIDVPTKNDLEDAFETLWGPFRLFSFGHKKIGSAVVLSAILSILTINVTKTRPGFLIDAAKAGSGKTLLADCIQYLCKGSTGVEVFNEDTFIQDVFSHFLDKNSCILFDNLYNGYTLNSKDVSAVLTTELIKNRLFHKQQMGSAVNRCLFLFTGNNIRLGEDNFRRVLKATIDTGEVSPENIEYSFNPLTMVMKNRKKMITAMTNLWNGFVNENMPIINSKPFGSFDEWNMLTRQWMLWIARKIETGEWRNIYNVEFGDPLDSIVLNSFESPTTAAKIQVIATLYDMYKDRKDGFSANDIAMSMYGSEGQKLLFVFQEALVDERKAKSPYSIGKYLSRIKDGPEIVAFDKEVLTMRLISKMGHGRKTTFHFEVAKKTDSVETKSNDNVISLSDRKNQHDNKKELLNDKFKDFK